MYSDKQVYDVSDNEKHIRTIHINTDVNVRESFPLATVILIAFVVTAVNLWVAIVAIGYNSNLISNDVQNYSANIVPLIVKSENNTELKDTIAVTMLEFLKSIVYKFNKISLINMENEAEEEFIDKATTISFRKQYNKTATEFRDNFQLHIESAVNNKSSVRLKRFTKMPFVASKPIGKHRLKNSTLKSKVDVETALNNIKSMLIGDFHYPSKKGLLNRMIYRHKDVVNDDVLEKTGHFKPFSPYFHSISNVSFLTTTPDSTPSLFMPPPPNKYLPITKPITLLRAESITKTEIAKQRQNKSSMLVEENFLTTNTPFSANRDAGKVSFRKLQLAEIGGTGDQFTEPSEDEKSNDDPVLIFVNPESNHFYRPKAPDFIKKSNDIIYKSVVPNQNQDPFLIDSSRRQHSSAQKHLSLTFTAPPTILTNSKRNSPISISTAEEVSSTTDINGTPFVEDEAPSNVHYRVLLPSPFLHSLFVRNSPSAPFKGTISVINETDIRTPILHRGFQPIFLNQISKYKPIPEPVSIQKHLYVMEVPSNVDKSPSALNWHENSSSFDGSFKSAKVNESLTFEEYFNSYDNSEERTPDVSSVGIFREPGHTQKDVSSVGIFREPGHTQKDYLDDVPRNKVRSDFIAFAYEILKQKRQVNPANEETGRHLVYKLVNEDYAAFKTISPEFVNKIDTFLKIYFDPNNINILQNIQRFISQHKSL